MSAPGIRSSSRRTLARLAAASTAAATAAAAALSLAALSLAALSLAALSLASASAATTTAAISTGSYGYVVTGATYTSTTADWTMPVAHCSAAGTYISIWTGLDGYTSDTAEQVGADAYCAGTTADYYGWYDMYPASPVDFSNAMEPGDHLAASVTFSGSRTFTLKLHDVTQGWTKTVRASLAGAARSSAETFAAVPNSLSCVPPATIANFAGVTVDGTPLGSDSPVKVTGTDPAITVSPVSGSSFTVSCGP